MYSNSSSNLHPHQQQVHYQRQEHQRQQHQPPLYPQIDPFHPSRLLPPLPTHSHIPSYSSSSPSPSRSYSRSYSPSRSHSYSRASSSSYSRSPSPSCSRSPSSSSSRSFSPPLSPPPPRLPPLPSSSFPLSPSSSSSSSSSSFSSSPSCSSPPLSVDDVTRSTLQIFSVDPRPGRSGGGGKDKEGNSVFKLLSEKCRSEMGVEIVKEWLMNPITDPVVLKRRAQDIECCMMMEYENYFRTIKPLFSGLVALRSAINRFRSNTAKRADWSRLLRVMKNLILLKEETKMQKESMKKIGEKRERERERRREMDAEEEEERKRRGNEPSILSTPANSSLSSSQLSSYSFHPSFSISVLYPSAFHDLFHVDWDGVNERMRLIDRVINFRISGRNRMRVERHAKGQRKKAREGDKEEREVEEGPVGSEAVKSEGEEEVRREGVRITDHPNILAAMEANSKGTELASLAVPIGSTRKRRRRLRRPFNRSYALDGSSVNAPFVGNGGVGVIGNAVGINVGVDEELDRLYAGRDEGIPKLLQQWTTTHVPMRPTSIPANYSYIYYVPDRKYLVRVPIVPQLEVLVQRKPAAFSAPTPGGEPSTDTDPACDVTVSASLASKALQSELFRCYWKVEYVTISFLYCETPESRCLSRKLMELEEQIYVKQRQMLGGISEKIVECAEGMEKATRSAAMIDALGALAVTFGDLKWNRPHIIDAALPDKLLIYEGWHPLLVEPLTQQRRTVHHNHTLMGETRKVITHLMEGDKKNEQGQEMEQEKSGQEDVIRIQLLTGTNESGKSVYLRQVGIACYLAHCGLFVPAQLMQFSVMDKIVIVSPHAQPSKREPSKTNSKDAATCSHWFRSSTRIIDDTSFAGDAANVGMIVREATTRSLCLIDEFGRGTDWNSCVALQIAFLQYFQEQRNSAPKLIFTTHQPIIALHPFCSLQELESNLLFTHMKVKETISSCTPAHDTPALTPSSRPHHHHSRYLHHSRPRPSHGGHESRDRQTATIPIPADQATHETFALVGDFTEMESGEIYSDSASASASPHTSSSDVDEMNLMQLDRGEARDRRSPVHVVPIPLGAVPLFRISVGWNDHSYSYPYKCARAAGWDRSTIHRAIQEQQYYSIQPIPGGYDQHDARTQLNSTETELEHEHELQPEPDSISPAINHDGNMNMDLHQYQQLQQPLKTRLADVVASLSASLVLLDQLDRVYDSASSQIKHTETETETQSQQEEEEEGKEEIEKVATHTNTNQAKGTDADVDANGERESEKETTVVDASAVVARTNQSLSPLVSVLRELCHQGEAVERSMQQLSM